MSTTEISYRGLESVPRHPEGLGIAIQWMMWAAAVLCLMAVLLAWQSADDASTQADTGCKLVALPNAGVPYQAGYRCADGSILFPEQRGR